jgi:hypothetical protein
MARDSFPARATAQKSINEETHAKHNDTTPTTLGSWVTRRPQPLPAEHILPSGIASTKTLLFALHG